MAIHDTALTILEEIGMKVLSERRGRFMRKAVPMLNLVPTGCALAAPW